MIKDIIDQYVAIMETLKKRSSLAIQDDKQAYLKSGQNRSAGKLLLIDQADYGTQHIFFDDNATEDEKSQIDVVDIINGQGVPPKKTMGKYIFKVEPHRAIMEPDYFIKLIESAE
jgi:hypothetical protein